MSHLDRQPSPDPRRQIPRTDVLLADERLAPARRELGDVLVKRAIQDAQHRVRTGELAVADLMTAVLQSMPSTASSLRPVINATGVVLHTNLGRAPLSPAAVDALTAAAGYVDVEFDLVAGVRAGRGRATLAALRERVPVAGDALVVNNGAAALVLAATVLAGGREIVISRGELVEIGDGFRIPELLAATGAVLREVGTTNRTHLDDYAAAVGDRTGFILKVHPSNFAVSGFTSATTVQELATLGVPVVGDIGSGLLEPDPDLPDEPDAASWLKAGADLVTASGDKLLGGPQAGLMLGAADLVARLRRHPLYRALRVDKLTLAALEATLTGPPTPTRAALSADADDLRRRAEQLAVGLAARGLNATAVPSDGLVGGGGAPELLLSGWAVELPAPYAQALRVGRSAVVTRVDRGRCLMDLRCVPPADDRTLLAAVLAAREAVDGGGDGVGGQEPPCT